MVETLLSLLFFIAAVLLALWPSLAIKTIRELRQSGRSGMSHACELETSVYQIGRGLLRGDREIDLQ